MSSTVERATPHEPSENAAGDPLPPGCDAPLAMLVHLDRPCDLAAAAVVLREAVRAFFAERGRSERRRLRELFRRGRVSLVIGLAFVALTIMATRLAEASWPDAGFVRVLEESLLIIGGSQCGGRSRSSSTTGGRSARTRASSSGSP